MRNLSSAAPLLFALLVAGVDSRPAVASRVEQWPLLPPAGSLEPAFSAKPVPDSELAEPIGAQGQSRSSGEPMRSPPHFSDGIVPSLGSLDAIGSAHVRNLSPKISPPNISPNISPKISPKISPPNISPLQLSQASPAPISAPIPSQAPESNFDRPERPAEPLPAEPLPQLPPVEDLFPASPSAPNLPGDVPGDVEATIVVEGYRVVGSTVFSEAELAEATKPYVGSITFAQLLQARSAITQLYVTKGYVTSGAFIPPQTLNQGQVTIQVLEGTLEDIKVLGTNHLKPFYVRDRLALAGAKPLNVNQLLEGLRLLQLDPLLSSISADLQAGIQPGTSLLEVNVTESDPFSTTLVLDNGRSPSVGTVRRKIQFDHRNLVGLGDALGLAYSNTEGSNSLDVSYSVPFNAKDGTFKVAYGRTRSNVIDDDFSVLDISARSKYYELSVRQPVERTPTRDIALGLTFSRQETQTRLGFADIGPFPLSAGASETGETKISALRFFQEWSDRNSKQVLAARSQFSLGVPWFEATDNANKPDNLPDSEFFAWRAQGQWVRLLTSETLLLVKGDVQIGDRTLVPLEQFGFGGGNSVRGYRQDAILSDSGFQVSTELRLPIARIPKLKGILQVAPFLDFAHGWNNQTPQPDFKNLLGTGIGLLWRQGNNFSARLDWGYPLLNREEDRDNLQEKGIYFSVDYTPF